MPTEHGNFPEIPGILGRLALAEITHFNRDCGQSVGTEFGAELYNAGHAAFEQPESPRMLETYIASRNPCSESYELQGPGGTSIGRPDDADLKSAGCPRPNLSIRVKGESSLGRALDDAAVSRRKCVCLHGTSVRGIQPSR